MKNLEFSIDFMVYDFMVQLSGKTRCNLITQINSMRNKRWQHHIKTKNIEVPEGERVLSKTEGIVISIIGLRDGEPFTASWLANSISSMLKQGKTCDKAHRYPEILYVRMQFNESWTEIQEKDTQNFHIENMWRLFNNWKLNSPINSCYRTVKK